MKKIWFLSLFSLLIFGRTYVHWAYTPTETDTQQLNTIKNTLNTVSSADLRSYYQQFAILAQTANGTDPKLDYFLQNLRDYSYTQFSTQKALAKELSKSDKAHFVDEFKDNLLLPDSISSSCLGFYNLLDNMSFANNFPTALTIAVRYRESTCWYVLPKNGDWPFQIVSKHYWTGEMTETLFKQALQDFFDFANNKISRYNKSNQKDNLSINLSYTGASLVDLLRFSALYNWLSWASVYWDIQPAAPKYFWEWYKNTIRTGNTQKDGILSAFIKASQRELVQ